MEISTEWSSAPLHLSVVVIEKGAFELPSTTVEKDMEIQEVVAIIFEALETILNEWGNRQEELGPEKN